MKNNSSAFGDQPLGNLLRKQAIPASIGILVMSIYGIVDTIFVGKWVSTIAIGAITVVLPIQYLISSIGMSIGIGGSSVISRSLGEGNQEKANKTFANQISLVVGFSILFLIFGLIFSEEILRFFGAKGGILPPALAYFNIILIGLPFLSWAMMTNNVIRAEGHPKTAMIAMMVPALFNLVLDPIFILVLDWGIEGAAWATTISFVACAMYTSYFFLSGKTQLSIKNHNLFSIDRKIVSEISGIGSVTLARQGAISVLSIVLNNSLIVFGGEIALSAFGIIARVMMFANFPVFGITQGFLPIAGYNYGAKNYPRVKELVTMSVKYATYIAIAIFILILSFAQEIVELFTNDVELIKMTVPALRLVFAATPLIAINLIVSGYYQAIGKPLPAMLLALSKQVFTLIPLLLILSYFFGLDGIWYSFGIADFLTAIISFIFFRSALKNLKLKN